MYPLAYSRAQVTSRGYIKLYRAGNQHTLTSSIIATMRTALLASILFTGLFGSSAAIPIPVPYYDFCRTLWLFALPCADVGSKLVQQIQAFNPVNVCEKCHYTLLSATNSSIHAHHTSPDNLHVESIEFTLHRTMLTSSCRVSAQSASVTVTSFFDSGINYCNLYNLLTASGLNVAPGFIEMTSEWACLGYGFATCRT
uniref:Uncharacterized protein n=1 Tax=Seriola lalandi dorsalis TaxID=1841481 RepID=A0A3B4YC11_SERLL